jgi:integrase
VRGHVRRRGKGWVFVVYVGKDPVGKDRYKWSRSWPTKREAERELSKALHRADAGDDPLPEKVTVAQLADRFFEHRELHNKPRPRVRQRQERLIRARILPAIGNVEVRKVKPATCQQVLDAFIDGHAERTVGQLKAAASTMFETALRWGLIAINPWRATTTPTPSKPGLKVPNAQEVGALIEAAQSTQWGVAVHIAARTGCRRGELCAFRWSNVDLDNGTIRIVEALQRVNHELVRTPPKTARAVRDVPLTADLVTRLRQAKAEQARRRLELGPLWQDTDLVIHRGDGGPVDPDSLSHGFARIADSVGLGDVRLHDLRHHVASKLASSGTLGPHETSAMLGHASTSFTMSTYAHPDEASVERTRRALEGGLGS